MPSAQSNPYHRSLRAGSRLHVRRQAEGTTFFPMIDFGHIDPIQPNFNPETLDRVDGWGGVGQVVDQEVTQMSANMEITCYSFNPEVFELAFAADPAATMNQAATQITDADHNNVLVGNLVKVVDASGNPIYNLASIDSITLDPGGADTSLTLGTDYTVEDLVLGTFRLTPGAAAGAKGTEVNLHVTFTPNALSGGRVISPMTKPLVDVDFWAYWAANDFSHYYVWEGCGTLRTNTFNAAFTDWTQVQVTLQVLADLSQPNQPAGKLTKIFGDLENA
ncbi:MAG: hypothetical protein AAGI54_04130 [Planctomycetota bacterium]